jgi:hypothetical protein
LVSMQACHQFFECEDWRHVGRIATGTVSRLR